jgi:2-C-methyl-D-erythritol 4-phosphate cytidylyltransferase
MLVERMGVPIRLVPGDPTNIKITHPTDLLLAEAILQKAKPSEP